MSPRFVLFGPSHLTALALTLAVPLALALLARHEHLGRHADRLTRIVIADLEFVLTASTSFWNGLATHNRGELLGALADSWLQLGEPVKAKAYLDRMTGELPDTSYAKNAALRLADPTAKTPLTCLGCH